VYSALYLLSKGLTWCLNLKALFLITLILFFSKKHRKMNKKLLSILGLGLGLSYTAHAQQFIVDHDTVATTTTGTAPHPEVYDPLGDDWDYIEIHNKITNVTNEAFVYNWQVLLDETIIPTGWTVYGFCDNFICRSPQLPWITTGEIQTSAELMPGTTGPSSNNDLKALFCAPTDKPDGEGILRLRIFVPDGQADTITFKVKKTNDVGVSKLTVSDTRVMIFPNPNVEGLLQVYADKSLKASKLSVVNVLGSNVLNQNIAMGTEITKVDISHLPSGIYVSQLINENGEIITSRKFSKK
jgi:hypothetical protein